MSEEVFGRYARWYDAIYSDKPYAAECDVIDAVAAPHIGPGPWRVLDLGCGTARHASELARRGNDVTAVDRSPAMLSLAVDETVRFVLGDLRTVTLDQTFDLVVSLFGVLSYQLSDDDVAAAMCAARRHLRARGLFVCDYWHAPAVRAMGPTRKLKQARAGHLLVHREAIPLGLDVRRRRNTTRYVVRVTDEAGRLVDEVCEEHTVRFFDPGEVAAQAAAAGFTIVETFADWSRTTPLNDRAWTAVLVALAT